MKLKSTCLWGWVALILSAGFLASASPVRSQDLSLISPIDCDLTDTCHIQQYVDLDTGPGVADFLCSSLTYDGHKGTDFALPTRSMIRDGVAVLAAAPGTVRGLRDGMPDTGLSAETAESLRERECGNGLVLAHSDGWETQYCHLREGSLTVKAGQRVETGEKLGEVGMSGLAEFAHLHFSVRRFGEVIDPFAPTGQTPCSSTPADDLWMSPMAVRPGGIIAVGASHAVPDFGAVKAGTVAPAEQNGDALVIWSYLFGTRAGDVVQMSMTGPEGFEVSRDIKLERTQAQSFRAIGRKRRTETWPEGRYTGAAELIRNGRVIERRDFSIELP